MSQSRNSRTQRLKSAMKEVRAAKNQQQGQGTAKQQQLNVPRKRIELPEAPDADQPFYDLDNTPHYFEDSGMKRISAAFLTHKNRRWRYRPFSFPIATTQGREQEFFFDFYVYDANTIIRLIIVVPSESRELWDKLGRFKRQFPMYNYEVWTPPILAEMCAKNRLRF